MKEDAVEVSNRTFFHEDFCDVFGEEGRKRAALGVWRDE